MTCKVTVLKNMLNDELAKEYCQSKITPCPMHSEGQEFILKELIKPEKFCDWAWIDISRCIMALLAGGSFSGEAFNGWMKQDKTMIVCCSDGIRPSVFKLEVID